MNKFFDPNFVIVLIVAAGCAGVGWEICKLCSIFGH